MGKWLGVVLGGIFAAAMLGFGIGAPAAGSSGHGNDHRMIQVVAVVTELKLIAVSTTGPSLGDEIVFSQKLLQGQEEVGHEGTVCTTVSLERSEAECIATYSFSEGQITAQGLITLGSSAPYEVAITGGSGEYRGVGGVLEVMQVSASTGNLTFDLQG